MHFVQNDQTIEVFPKIEFRTGKLRTIQLRFEIEIERIT